MNMLFLDQAAQQGGSALATFGMFGFWILIFVALYFIILRPQKKKQKEEDALRNSIEIGDDVTTIGGIVGRIIAIREDDETIVIETGSDKTRIRFKKWAISSVDTPKKQPKKEDKKKNSKKDKADDKEDEKKVKLSKDDTEDEE